MLMDIDQTSRQLSSLIPLLSNALTIEVVIAGGPQIHTFLYCYKSISFNTKESNRSLVNQIALWAALKSYPSLLTRMVNLNLVDYSLSFTICRKVIGGMSSIWLTANMRWYLKWSKGLFSKIGLCLRISALYDAFRSARLSLKSRSSKSQKGYNPVPPATIITLPGVILCSLNPSPRGSLRCSVLNFLAMSLGVNIPFGQSLTSRERQLTSSISWSPLSLSGISAATLLLIVYERVSSFIPRFLERKLMFLGSRKPTEVYNLVV